eukprot:5474991-Prorocentrum_lima.AAC.1
MTSSLVGSEMCIRDRCSRDAAQQQHHLLLQWAWRAPEMGGTSQSAKTPVSYTHLTLPTICSV